MEKTSKKKILIFIDHYLPGHKFGGPTQSVANIVDHLCYKFEFYIFTRDRDLGESKPYDGIEINKWNAQKSSMVYYSDPRGCSPFGIYNFLKENSFDLIYLNSFFSPVSAGLPLLFRLFRIYKDVPIIIAPRGQFAASALKIKSFKKRVYLRLSKLIGLYNNLIWQASSKFELDDIILELGTQLAHNIMIAPDLLPNKSISEEMSLKMLQTDFLRIIFLSRISREKNLHFLLKTLQNVKVKIELNIYGPRIDMNYWREIEDLIKCLPPNICVNYYGEILHKDVIDVFSRHDLFVFPTQGENFGHVIYESLTAGTPVLLSNQTPWDSDIDGGIQVLPLDSQKWIEALNDWAKLDQDSINMRKKAAFNYAKYYQTESDAIQQNLELFTTALKIHVE